MYSVVASATCYICDRCSKNKLDRLLFCEPGRGVLFLGAVAEAQAYRIAGDFFYPMTDYTVRDLLYDYYAKCNLPPGVTVYIVESYVLPSGTIRLGRDTTLYGFSEQASPGAGDQSQFTTRSVEMTEYPAPFSGGFRRLLAGYEPRSKTLLITGEHDTP